MKKEPILSSQKAEPRRKQREPEGSQARRVDITGHKRDEEKLLKAYEELELRVQQRTEELRAANSKLMEEIDERKKVDEQLTLTMLRLEAHIDNSPLAVVEFDPQGRIIRWSNEAEQIFGWSAAEVFGLTVFDLRFVYEEDAGLVTQIFNDMALGERSREHHTNRNYRKDGSVIYCEWYNSALYDVHGRLTSLLSLVLDVSSRRQTEEALLESEQKYRQLMENVHDLVCEVDAQARYVFVSSQYEQVLGYTPEELVGKPVRELIHPDDLKNSTPAYQKLIESQTVSRNEWRFRHKNGKWRWFDVVANTFEKSPGIVHTAVIARDITESKHASELLRESEERFSKSFLFSPTGINIFRLDDGRCVDVNDTYLALVGYSREEMLGHTADELGLIVNPVERLNWIGELQKHDVVQNLDIQVRHKSGRIMDFLFSIAIIEMNGTPMGMVQVVDITERKKAEEALRAANEELTRFNQNMIGRELRMIELKKEVNELCRQSGQPPRYSIDLEKEGQ